MSVKVITQNPAPDGVLVAHSAEAGVHTIRMSLYSTLTATYPEGDTITWEIVTPPAGTFEEDEGYGADVVLPNFIYYPPEDPGYGTDFFTFRIYDAELDAYSPEARVYMSTSPTTPMPDGRIGGQVKTDAALEQIDVYSTKNSQQTFDIVGTYSNQEVVGTILEDPFCDIWQQNESFQYTEPWRYKVRFSDDTEGWVDADSIILVAASAGYLKNLDTITVAGNLMTETGAIDSPYSISWQFSTTHVCGQYIDGTWWVVGPVTVSAITPSPSNSFSGTNHGSMVNAVPGGEHGFDSRAHFVRDAQTGYHTHGYRPELNVALNLPLTLAIGDVLLSSQSELYREEACLKVVASLTVVSAPPPEFSFRPSIYGADRGAAWVESDVSYARLRQIAPPNGHDISTEFVGLAMSNGLPFFELSGHSFGQRVQGRANTADWGQTYGRAIAHKYGMLVLWVNCQRTQAEKRDVVMHLVQQGLDVYNYVTAHPAVSWISGSLPSPFYHDGGIKFGRKLPMVFAAVVLNDTAMLAKCLELDIFQEDTQIFEVAGTWPGDPNGDVSKPVWVPPPGNSYYDDYFPDPPAVPTYVGATYTAEMLGTPEWGIRHLGESSRPFSVENPSNDTSAWNAPYRDINNNGMLVAWGAATLMGIREEWGNPVAFRYMIRAAYRGDGWWGGAIYQDRAFQHGICGTIPDPLPDEWVGTNAGDPIPPGQEGGTFPAGMEPILWSTTSVHSVSSQQLIEGAVQASPAVHAIDGNPATSWGTKWTHPYANPPHWIVIDLGSSKVITGLYYQAPAAANGTFYGNIQNYEVHVSNDASTWGASVASGTWATDTVPKTLTFAATARYVRLKALSGASNMATAVRIAILQATP